jgi:leucyl aminopeptidase (aminopeptidase T)
MLKKELMDCVEQVYDYGKKLIVMWNDYRMQQVRLETANLRKIEQMKQANIEEMDARKTIRYKLQKQANYNAWRNSPDYDPKKDRYNR